MPFILSDQNADFASAAATLFVGRWRSLASPCAARPFRRLARQPFQASGNPRRQMIVRGAALALGRRQAAVDRHDATITVRRIPAAVAVGTTAAWRRRHRREPVGGWLLRWEWQSRPCRMRRVCHPARRFAWHTFRRLRRGRRRKLDRAGRPRVRCGLLMPRRVRV